jgi:hypothetical protein
VNNKLLEEQVIPAGYLRFLFTTMRVEIHSSKIFCIGKIVLRIKCIMSTSVTRKALNLDDKVKAINMCDGGKSCRAMAEEMGVGRTQIMNILKRKSEILDDFKTIM